MRRGRCLVTAGALLALAAAPAAAQQVARGWPAEPGAAVRIFNLAGSTRVLGWDRDSIAVSGTVADGGRVIGGGTRGAVKIAVEPARPGGEPPPAVLEVRVPRGVVIAVKSSTADVHVSGLTRSIEIASVGGAVTVDGEPGQVTAESMTGGVRVEGSIPVVRVRTAGGQAVVRGEVEDLRVETVSGPIDVRAAGPRQARLESVSGAVRYEGGLAAGAALEVQTHDGPVTLALPASARAELELTTFDGRVVNRFAQPAAQAGSGKPLRFSLNGGGARVTVRTLKGDVTVARR